MKKIVKKVMTGVLAVTMMTTMVPTTASADASKETIVLYTNDVHCATDDYSKFAAYREQLEQEGYEVIVVDVGDAVQGETIGNLTEGDAIMDIMDAAEYDFAVPGNHEYDYGMEKFLELTEDGSSFQYLACNFVNLQTGQTVLAPYEIETVNGEDIAFIGIATPESYTKSTPAYFQDENGNNIYGFSESDFYGVIQSTVDAAIAEGADRVVAMGHLGIDGVTSGWKSTDVIANTTGIDVFLDAHSHEVISGSTYTNKDGEAVLLSSTGTKFKYFGQLTLGADSTETTQLINPDTIDVSTYSEAAQEEYNEVQQIVDAYNSDFEYLYEIVGTSEVELTLYHPDTGEWIIRTSETNMGDFVADAYRAITGADAAIVNSGGIRDIIEAGDVTRKDLMDVNPWNNDMCVLEVTGQQILDALEHGARLYPEECGGFLQVSGLTYEIKSWVESPVILDDQGSFKDIDDTKERRVTNVMINGTEINPTGKYKLAGSFYMLQQNGDGFTMFKNCSIVRHTTLKADAEMLIQYFTENLNGTVTAKQYGNALGDGRIKILTEETQTGDGDSSSVDEGEDSNTTEGTDNSGNGDSSTDTNQNGTGTSTGTNSGTTSTGKNDTTSTGNTSTTKKTTTSKTSTTAKTGDSSNISIYISLMAAALACLGGTLAYKKKNEKTYERWM